MHPVPDRLFDQADALINNHQDETDLRRAVSAAYYGVFHFTCRAFADQILGPSGRSNPLYSVVYCSLDHRDLTAVCRHIRGSKVEKSIQPFEPAGGFGSITDFAVTALSLHERRNLADYELAPLSYLDALDSVSGARPAVERFLAATPEQREAFLILLKFKPRQRS